MRNEWNLALKTHLRYLDAKKPVVWAGDFDCIPTKKDLDKKAMGYWNKMSGLSEVEREDFAALLHPTNETEPRFSDVWRHLHPDAEEFTHASMKFGAWRLDSFIESERILERVLCCEIRCELKDLELSDHWPVTPDLTV